MVLNKLYVKVSAFTELTGWKVHVGRVPGMDGIMGVAP